MINRLLQLGLHPALSFQQQNKIRVFNTACTLVLAIFFFYFVFALLSGFYLAVGISVFFIATIIAALYLVHLRRYSAAFHTGVISSFVFLNGYTLLFGNDSKSYIYFLFMPVACTILFDRINTILKYVALSTLCLLLNVFFIETLPPYYRLGDMWYFGYPNLVFAVVLIFMGLRVFKTENLDYAALIEEQKHRLQEKNQEMTDSIGYARRIQYTLLAGTQLLEAGLPEHFVLFKPKDIVSGDFYWAVKKENLFYLAVCDSTGHGVPGAFMSLLNISFLNEAVNEKNIAEPHEVLNHVRRRLIENISQEGARDGMDAILLCYDKQNNLLTYSAAHNAPVLVRGGRGQALAKDKMPVGEGEKKESFTLRHIALQPGDCLYLGTDGYADQFGGPQGKKFKARQLEELLLSHHRQPMAEQERLLMTAFEAWRGSLEQVDDVCLIGVRF